MEKNAFTSEKENINFPQVYMRLRTVLDALEINTLRYCLGKKEKSAKIRRAEEIIALLMPIVEKCQPEMNQDGSNNCPEGCNYCNGCCVPYSCP